jgi:hypothetical protein
MIVVVAAAAVSLFLSARSQSSPTTPQETFSEKRKPDVSI